MSAAVTKLPTAATRKVVNNRWSAQRDAGYLLRDEQGNRFLHPHDLKKIREVEPLADYMLANPLTAERRILFAILRALDHETQLKAALGVIGDEDADAFMKVALADGCKSWWIGQAIARRQAADAKGGEA